MAQGLDPRYTRTGALARAAQAGYVARMAALPCPNKDQSLVKLACPVHYGSTCPKNAG